ncbi:MAG: hypothetical protein F4Z04_17845 [Acidobacteria bacterium]|nr:hypothetical protein [Acidobacteriota bacterium]
MKTTTERHFTETAAGTPPREDAAGTDTVARAADQSVEEAVEYVLSDCFFTVGQAIGMRMTVDHEAVVWWRDHFRSKFLSAMRRHGNRWLEDRENVTAVGWLLAERAVRQAAGRDVIDVEAARRAAADVERYCQLHAQRAARGSNCPTEADPRLAGYWCLPYPGREDD